MSEQKYIWWPLQFLCLFLCARLTAQPDARIKWADGLARGVHFPEATAGLNPDSAANTFDYTIRLKGEETAVMGTIKRTNEGVLFLPLWPFSPGLVYHIFYRDKLIGRFRVRENKGAPPNVIIYPGPDTLPRNLLKFYLRFSRPMSADQSRKHVKIVNSVNDTLHRALLDLQPELWNEDQTVLTIWLDPGRIKRDLLLNRELGTPLVPGGHYRLLVLPGWKDKTGIPLSRLTSKAFAAGVADRSRPDPETWSLATPPPGTTEPLVIRFGESLDYMLAINAIHVLCEGLPVEGEVRLSENEAVWAFTPASPWQRGAYLLEIESRVEDLAGNNLDRLFDTDLSESKSALDLNVKSHQLGFFVR